MIVTNFYVTYSTRVCSNTCNTYSLICTNTINKLSFLIYLYLTNFLFPVMSIYYRMPTKFKINHSRTLCFSFFFSLNFIYILIIDFTWINCWLINLKKLLWEWFSIIYAYKSCFLSLINFFLLIVRYLNSFINR